MSISAQTVIAVNRFGLGARPGELAQVGSDGRDWLRAQIDHPGEVPPRIAALMPSSEVLAKFQTMRQQIAQNKTRDSEKSTADQPTADEPRPMRDLLGPAYREQVVARYSVAITTEQPFRERLVHFWSNHFAVSADKPPVTGLVGGLENEAIRPNLNGHFADLLLAVERHPAMLVYLDNQASIGPDSPAAVRMKRFGRNHRKFDINENLGREILELHTLGVDGGYDQQDVIGLSKILTGWSVGGGRGRRKAGTPGEFQFRASIHQPGVQQVLGTRYAQDGVAQGQAVLRDLAVHPATARHVATKLARHFISDDPPANAVERITSAYLESDGHLPTVHRALLDCPEAWAQPLMKYKTPHDYLISGLRALDVSTFRDRELIGALMLLGQPAYRPGSPAGWPDTQADWDGADGLMKRIEWAAAIGRRAGEQLDPERLASNALGPVLDEHSATVIRRAESRAQAVALVLASPEFQRR